MRNIAVRSGELKQNIAFDVVHQLNPVDIALSALVPLDGMPLILGPYVPRWPPDNDPASRRRDQWLTVAEKPIRWYEQRRAGALLLSTPEAQSKTVVFGELSPTIHYLSAGVDDKRFQMVPVDSPNRGMRILFLSHLEERKGIFTLIEAFQRVVRVFPDASLLVAGEGSAYELVREQIMSSPACERISLFGRTQPNEVPALLAASDVFCQPSRGEPFGISALEAMAAGLPVIGTDAGGLRYLLGGDRRVLVPVDDPRALADGLISVLADKDLAASLGKANRIRVQREYAWDAIIDRLELIYGQALVRRRQG